MIDEGEELRPRDVVAAAGEEKGVKGLLAQLLNHSRETVFPLLGSLWNSSSGPYTSSLRVEPARASFVTGCLKWLLR